MMRSPLLHCIGSWLYAGITNTLARITSAIAARIHLEALHIVFFISSYPVLKVSALPAVESILPLSIVKFDRYPPGLLKLSWHRLIMSLI